MIDSKTRNHHSSDRLLVSLVRDGLNPGIVDALMRAGPDWDSLFEEAIKEGLFYPLYKSLFASKTADMLVSGESRERVRQTYYLHVFRSLCFLRGIERILDRIEELRIEALLLKGPAVDSFVYDGFLRPRLDLDIVVRDEDMPSFEEMLRDLGYAASEGEKNYPIPEYLNSRLYTTAASEGLIPVHAHRHLINNMFLTVDNFLSMDMEAVWEQTEPYQARRYIRMLKPEINIIYLCEHGLKHAFEQTVFLYEIERLIRLYGERLDWKKILSLTEGFGLGRIVYYGIFFLQEIFSVSIPAEIMGRLKPERLSVGERIFVRDFLEKKRRRYASYPVYCAMRTGLPQKINFICHTIFPPRFTIKGCLRRMGRLILP